MLRSYTSLLTYNYIRAFFFSVRKVSEKRRSTFIHLPLLYMAKIYINKNFHCTERIFIMILLGALIYFTFEITSLYPNK